jgi:hypothetical protein
MHRYCLDAEFCQESNLRIISSLCAGKTAVSLERLQPTNHTAHMIQTALQALLHA